MKPLSAVTTVRTIRRLREHSKASRDIAARTFLIRVERQLMALLLASQEVPVQSLQTTSIQ